MIGGLLFRKSITSYINKSNTNIIRINPKIIFHNVTLHNSTMANKNNKNNGTEQKFVEVLTNEDIKYPNVRVVYENDTTGKTEWKIMARKEAIDFAKSKSLDLVLVNEKAVPPVCKLDKYFDVLSDKKKKEKELRIKQKTKSMKEMLLTAGIEPRDFNTKMNKVREFLVIGHIVKVTIVAKKFTKNKRFKDGVRRDRMSGFDETVLMLLESIENLPILVTENKIKKPVFKIDSKIANNPKVKAKIAAVAALQATKDNPANKEAEVDNDEEEDDEEDDTTTPGINPFTGQRLVTRREFLLSPKSAMKQFNLDTITTTTATSSSSIPPSKK